MKLRKKDYLILTFAASMGPLTGEAIEWAQKNLPYNPHLVAIGDLLSLPGGIVGGFFYPQGIEIGSGSIAFAYIALVVNWACYSICWYLTMRWLFDFIARRRRKMLA